MNWKKTTLISLIIFAIGFIMVDGKNEVNLITKIGAIIIFFSLLSPLFFKMWLGTEKTKTQKAVLGLLIVLFLYLLALAVIPPSVGIKKESQAGKIYPLPR